MSLDVFDCVDLLDGFFSLHKRSPTLHGDAPLRAVQGCPPFLDGNAFGFELRFSGLGLAVDHGASDAVRMLDELAPGFDYRGTLERAASQGYLNEAWMAQLGPNWWWQSADQPLTYIWTGLVVRPRQGYQLLLGNLPNCPNLCQDLHDSYLTDSSCWTPLALCLSTAAEPNLLQGLCAGLTPLPASTHIGSATLKQQPMVGQRLLDYYNPDYFAQKLADPPTQKYARQMRRSLGDDYVQDEVDLLIVGPTEDSLSRLHLVPGAQLADPGISIYPDADIHLRFGGRGLHAAMGEQWPRAYRAARAEWMRLFDERGAQYLDNMTFDGAGCVHTTPGPPLLLANIEPLVRFITRPGWSALFDATNTLSESGPHGLRGLIRSDQFHAGVFALQWHRQPQDLTINYDQPLGRVRPIPNALLDATFTLQTLS